MKTILYKSVLALIFLVFGTMSSTYATNYTFTPTTDNLWSNGVNWSPNRPTADIVSNGDVVTYTDHMIIDVPINIEQGGTVTPIANPPLSCRLEIDIPSSSSFLFSIYNEGILNVQNLDFKKGWIDNKSTGDITCVGTGMFGTGNLNQQMQTTIWNRSGGEVYFVDGVTDFYGHINNSGDVIVISNATLNIHSDSMMNYSGGNGQFYCSGTVQINGYFHNYGVITCAAGGVIGGTGSINGAGSGNNGVVNIDPAGFVNSGLSPGKLDFNQAVNFNASSTTIIEIGGLQSGQDYDVVGGVGTKNLDGTLRIIPYNWYTPSIGESFTIIEGTIVGTFSNIDNQILPADRKWDVRYDSNQVIISVVSAYPSSISEANRLGFSVYPNPSKDVVNILGLQKSEIYQIINSVGHIIRSGELSKTESLNISDLPLGNYFLQIGSAQKTGVIRFTKH